MKKIFTKINLFVLGGMFLQASFAESLERNPQGRFPKDVEAAIEKLPDRTLSLPFILSQAMEHADSFQAIIGSAPASFVPELLATAPLDVLLSGNYTYLKDDQKVASASSTNIDNTKSYTLGVSKMFSTGTSLSAKLEGSKSEYSVATINSSTAESVVTLGVEQSLWKDFLGWATRKNVYAGELKSKVALDQVIESAEEWTLGIAQTFYNTWLNQQRVRAAREKLKMQNDLTRITKLRVNRGASAEPELLQIESSYILSKTQESQTSEELKKVWRQLISVVKLPPQWMNIDPIDIPILVEKEPDDILSYCKTVKTELIDQGQTGTFNDVLSNPKVQRYERAAKANELAYEASKWNTWPDLKVFGQYGANGIDTNEMTKATSEAFDFSHKFWAVGLNLSVPLGFRANRAEVYKSVSDKLRSRAEANGAISNLELDLLGSCAEVNRLIDNKRLFEESLKNQTRRANLEQKRFQSGRVTIREAIQASNDLTDAQLMSYQNVAQLHLAYWNLRKLRGEVHNLMKEQVSKYE